MCGVVFARQRGVYNHFFARFEFHSGIHNFIGTSRITQADIECKFSASFLSMIGSKIKELQVYLEVTHFLATYSVGRDQQDHQHKLV